MSGEPPRYPLVYRSSLSGRLKAAYMANVRVGYVEERVNGIWVWQLIFVRPEGGSYLGRAFSEADAMKLLEMSCYQWAMEAGLLARPSLTGDKGEKETGRVPVPKVRSPESGAANDTRRASKGKRRAQSR